MSDWKIPEWHDTTALPRSARTSTAAERAVLIEIVQERAWHRCHQMVERLLALYRYGRDCDPTTGKCRVCGYRSGNPQWSDWHAWWGHHCDPEYDCWNDPWCPFGAWEMEWQYQMNRRDKQPAWVGADVDDSDKEDRWLEANGYYDNKW